MNLSVFFRFLSLPKLKLFVSKPLTKKKMGIWMLTERLYIDDGVFDIWQLTTSNIAMALRKSR